MSGGWFDAEAIAAERFDADLQQAAYEAEGRWFAAELRRAETLRSAGRLAEAAAACPHGGGYPLASLAAEHAGDPNAGEAGHRCADCGSRLDRPIGEEGVTVLVACEIPGRPA